MDDDRLLAHALVRALPEETAAHELDVTLGEPLPKRPLVNAWRAEHDGQEFALVLLEGRVSNDEKRRFLDAAGRMHALRTQPGLLKVHGVLEKRAAFLCDAPARGSLEGLPALGWPATRRLDLVRRVANALAELHEAGVVHGSLCPANVVFDKDYAPLLAEVGLVNLRESFDGDSEGVFGYGDYAAPEVRSGGEPGVTSDVYSLGRILLYATLEDSPATANALARATRAQPGWVDVVRRATAESPDQRYATAREFLDALDPLFDRVGTVEAEPPAPPPRPAPEARPAAAEPKVASELAFGKPQVKAPPRASPKTALVGAAMVIAVLALAFVTDLQGHGQGLSTAVAGAVAAGASLASLVVTPPPRWPIASRWILAAGIAAVVYAYDPAMIVGRYGALHRLAGDPAARRAAVTQLLARQRDLRGASLADLDLSGLDMRGADLRGTDLSRADLSHADLWGALVDGAVLADAHLEGAELNGISFAGSTGLPSAECDEATRFPQGWRCVEGHPALGSAE